MVSTSTIPTPLELYMIVKDAELIRRIMDSHRPEKITARALAKNVGWKSHSYVNRILAGDVRSVTPEAAAKIAYLLGVPQDLLFEPRASANASQNEKGAA